jgi:outer membrane protein OmpA-like peptidoglycan-associated protein
MILLLIYIIFLNLKLIIKMKIRNLTILVCLFGLTIFNTSCKSKKAIAKPAEPEPVVVTEPVKVVEPVKEIDTDGDGIPDSKDDCPEEKGTSENGGCPIVVVDNSKINFKNIQFEFNSSVLKTSSYATLDMIATQMKKYDSVNFVLNGHSSTEGTEQRNMMLSVDRANAVKSYLVNNGVITGRLKTEGFGELKPVASNDTEDNRSINRRVEIEIIK